MRTVHLGNKRKTFTPRIGEVFIVITEEEKRFIVKTYKAKDKLSPCIKECYLNNLSFIKRSPSCEAINCCDWERKDGKQVIFKCIKLLNT